MILSSRFPWLFMAFLCCFLVTSQKTFIPVDNDSVDLYYEDEGVGDALVFIPGWTTTSTFFNNQQQYFNDRFRVITYDPRSQGRSTKTHDGNTYAQHARDLYQLITTLELTNITLIGWASGSLTIYSYLERFGSKGINGVVIIDEPPKWIGDPKNEWVHGGFEDYKEGLHGLINDRLSETYAQIDWMLADSVDVETRNWMVDEMMGTPDHAALSLFIDGMISDNTSVLSDWSSKLPFLFLIRQAWFDQAKNWLSDHAPSVDVRQIGSHASFWSEPVKFNKTLDLFLIPKMLGNNQK